MEEDESDKVGLSPLRNILSCSINNVDHRRKPIFSDAEKFLLIEKYGAYKDILASRLTDAQTCKKKNELWARIAESNNAEYLELKMSLLNGNVQRTAKEVRKKWDNLTTSARKEFAEFRSGTLPPSALTFKILELTDDIVFNPQPIKEEDSADSPGETENGCLPVHVESDVQREMASSSAVTDNVTQANSLEPSTPIYSSLPKIAAGSLSFINERIQNTVHSGGTSSRLLDCRMGGQRVGFDETEKLISSAKKRPLDEFEGEIAVETFEESFKRKKYELEIERMQLENEKLRLEVRLTMLKLEKERRLMID